MGGLLISIRIRRRKNIERCLFFWIAHSLHFRFCVVRSNRASWFRTVILSHGERRVEEPLRCVRRIAACGSILGILAESSGQHWRIKHCWGPSTRAFALPQDDRFRARSCLGLDCGKSENAIARGGPECSLKVCWNRLRIRDTGRLGPNWLLQRRKALP